MKTESVEELLRAHLTKEGLVLCRSVDVNRYLDGMHEAYALRNLALLVQDVNQTPGVDQGWDDDITVERAVDGRLLNQCRFAS